MCAAVQFVRGEAKAFNIDAGRIALMGASAGAHLSGMAALAGESFSKAYPGDKHASVSPKVKALIGVYGVYDMAANWVHFQAQTPTDNPTDIFLGVPPMQDRELYFEASPISYATFANNSVSVFLSWGTRGRSRRLRSAIGGVPARAQASRFFCAHRHRAGGAALLDERPDRRAGQFHQLPGAAAPAVLG